MVKHNNNRHGYAVSFDKGNGYATDHGLVPTKILLHCLGIVLFMVSGSSQFMLPVSFFFSQ